MDQRFNLFRRLWALSVLALIGVTWNLWIPQSAFPQVPVLAELGKLPGIIDQIALGAMLLALVVVVITPVKNNLWQQGLGVFVAAAVLLILIDQHRFQPWMYLALITAVVLGTAKPAKAMQLLRWLVIGIYVWSAWSKCDVTFTTTLGQQFLSKLLGWAGFVEWPETVRRVLASLFPVGELAVAALLCWPRSWKWGVGASIVLHLLLLIALGPLGLQHRPGVLVWNLWFMVQNVLIFWPERTVLTDEETPIVEESLPAAALYVVAAALVWPIVETWQYCDHWPAWSVYAPRVERTSFFVHRSEKDRLPSPLQPFLEQASDDENWFHIRLDRWSLEQLSVPIYPQNRFQIAAAAAVARQFGLSQIRLVVYGSADRMTGDRASTTYNGLGELELANRKFVLGAKSLRPLVFDPPSQ